MTALCPRRPNSVKVKVKRERRVGHSLAEDGNGDVDGQDVGDAEQRDEFHWPVPEQPVDDALVQLVRSLLDGCTEEHLAVKNGPQSTSLGREHPNLSQALKVREQFQRVSIVPDKLGDARNMLRTSWAHAACERHRPI